LIHALRIFSDATHGIFPLPLFGLPPCFFRMLSGRNLRRVKLLD
jgi:hypothetical protein